MIHVRAEAVKNSKNAMVQTLRNILCDVHVESMVGNSDISINHIVYDTRNDIPSDSVYVALRGTKVDGHEMIDMAIDHGATAIICESIPRQLRPGVTYVKVGSTHHAIAKMSEAYFDYPSRKLKLIGVTGTNGKTTTATLLFSFFRTQGFHTLLLSTVENKIDEEIFPASQTTPDPYDISRLLARAVERGVTHGAMEVSSHASDQRRIAGLTFAGGIFTNITHDHLDYHGTFEEYARAKKLFFDGLTPDAFALSNRDDKEGEWMLKNTPAKKYFYSLRDESDFKGEILENSLEGLSLTINGSPLSIPLMGAFNAYNILGVYGTLVLLGIDEEKVREGLSLLTPPRGRLEFTKSSHDVLGVVDYAHTPDAVQNVLKTLREVTKCRIITVIGCGGDRDPLKRPLMGSLAHDMSDYTIFSSDNPRSEEIGKILDDMTGRLPDDDSWECVADRKEAIRRAVSMAHSGDIVLIAGKGHEEYQEVKGVKFHFNDMEELKKVFGI